ncbi:MAG: rhomboid family intramembrane serine protease [Hyphomicrobiaceae bacterium]
MSQRQPIFNVPGIVLALLVIFSAVHLLLWVVLPTEEGEWLMLALAFIPARMGALAGDLPGGHVTTYTSFVTHQFVHGNLAHLGINSAWLLAFGTPIARRTDALRFLVFFLICGIAGALVYLAVNGTERVVVVGASGAISGLMGAALRFVLRGAALRGPDTIESIRRIPLMTLAEALQDRRMLVVIIGWTALNVLLAQGAGAFIEAAGVAWEAHLGGFYAGFLLYGFFDRPPPPLAKPQGLVRDDAAGAE